MEAALTSALVRSGRIVDLAYAALVHQLGITQRFFPKGFGSLDLIDFHGDVQEFQRWPPPHFAQQHLPWKKLVSDTYNGHGYKVYKASFRTPCHGRVYDALPVESRTAHAMLIAPDRPAEGAPCVIHLAATGDHGYTRRTHLGLPLVQQGIATLALESPYYGQRKPHYQQGAKLLHVSDLLLLGRATIEESLLLLHWLGQAGHERLGKKRGMGWARQLAIEEANGWAIAWAYPQPGRKLHCMPAAARVRAGIACCPCPGITLPLASSIPINRPRSGPAISHIPTLTHRRFTHCT